VRVRRDQLILAAIAATVLAVIVAFAASSGVKTAPRPTPTPTGDRPLFGGGLEPGVRYRTRGFFPTLSFVAPDTEWMADAGPGAVVLQRRIRTDRPGSELPSRSSLTFRRTRPGRPTLHERMQRRRNVRVGAYEPVLIGDATAESFGVAYPDGRRRRVIALRGFAIELEGRTQRDLDRLQGPAAAVLRTLLIGR
jgi:hypothetical protein